MEVSSSFEPGCRPWRSATGQGTREREHESGRAQQIRTRAEHEGTAAEAHAQHAHRDAHGAGAELVGAWSEHRLWPCARLRSNVSMTLVNRRWIGR
jgi:hypothetical protein